MAGDIEPRQKTGVNSIRETSARRPVTFARMSPRRVIVVGGGAAGFFAAITCAETAPEAEVTVLERGPQFLAKVRISGGGRCNVTHACFDARELSTRFPRGERALLAPFKTFPASDTVRWFESRGAKLKIESDGRMFPVSDASQTIVECLLRAANAAKVRLLLNRGVERVARCAEGGFELILSQSGRRPQANSPRSAGGETERRTPDEQRIANPHAGALPSGKGEGDETGGETLTCDRLLLATGGCRAPVSGQLPVSLGHTLEPPVPSLFTFHIAKPWLRELTGISVESVEASVPGARLRESGALLLTHWGLSGPVILRLSAWGARVLHGLNYRFPLHLNWLPRLGAEAISAELHSRRQTQPARFIVNTPLSPLPARLWEQLVLAAGISRETRWATLSRAAQHGLVQQLIRTEFQVTGKSLNKDEFVTCGGVRLSEVNFKTMESRICPGLYFAGELLDIDGITGGFNFQAAWTTGWIAGQALAASVAFRSD
jgi:predicted flavoprotein YhiN